jgi:hypothetical protein
MNKIIKLTESDLKNLVKRIVKEQTTIDMSVIRDRTIKIKNYLGKTANLYSDPQNKNFVRQIPFESMWVEKDGTVIIRFSESKGQFDYAYDCTKPNIIQTKDWYSSEKPKSFYSNNLTPKLQQDFCTTSVGNTPAPQATFASAKTQTSNLAEDDRRIGYGTEEIRNLEKDLAPDEDIKLTDYTGTLTGEVVKKKDYVIHMLKDIIHDQEWDRIGDVILYIKHRM